MSQADDDNHADQLNENNDAYWQSRGYDERPDDWDESEEDQEDLNQKDLIYVIQAAIQSRYMRLYFLFLLGQFLIQAGVVVRRVLR